MICCQDRAQCIIELLTITYGREDVDEQITLLMPCLCLDSCSSRAEDPQQLCTICTPTAALHDVYTHSSCTQSVYP